MVRTKHLVPRDASPAAMAAVSRWVRSSENGRPWLILWQGVCVSPTSMRASPEREVGVAALGQVRVTSIASWVERKIPRTQGNMSPMASSRLPSARLQRVSNLA